MSDSPSLLPLFPHRIDKALKALAFDYGTQRIGVAFGQSVSGSAQPVSVLKARDGIPDWAQIQELINNWAPDVFVVGMPFNLDGSTSELLTRAVKFGNRLNGRFHLPVFGMDERLSSQEAIEQCVRKNGGNKETAIDHIAAQIILENWFSGLAQRSSAQDS